MPTFESPDPGIIDRPYVSQIPLDTLFKGLAYKQQEYDENFNALQGQADQLESITGEGPDAAAAAKVREAFNARLGQFRGANLMDPSVRAQLDDLTAKTSQALMPIARRTAIGQKMEAEKKEATDKGRKYFNPGITALQKYYSSGNYDPNFIPVSKPGVAADMDKILQTAHTIVTPDEEQVPVPGHPGTFMMRKVWSPDKLRPVIKGLLDAEPDHAAYMQQNFEEETAHIIWENFAPSMLEAAWKLKQKAKLANNTAVEAEADKGITLYSELAKNKFGPSLAKQHALEDYKNNYQEMFVTGMAATQDGAQTMSKWAEMDKQLSNDLVKLDHEYNLKGTLEDHKGGLKGLTGALLMDDFMDSLTGEPGVTTETHIFSGNDEWSDKTPVTGVVLEEKFGVKNASTMASGHNWTPIKSVPETVSKVLSKMTLYNGMGVATTQHRVAEDDKGNPLVFKSDDGRTIGYVENIVDVNGLSIGKRFNTMNVNQARAHATIGTSVAAQQGVKAWTVEDYNRRKTGAANSLSPEDKRAQILAANPDVPKNVAGLTVLYDPNINKYLQVPTDSVPSVQRDRPQVQIFQ
jgi:hypothetical protein